MMNTINNSTNNNYNLNNILIGAAGVCAGWEADTLTQKFLRNTYGKRTIKQVKALQGNEFKQYVQTAVNKNGLDKTNFKILDLNKNTAGEIWKIFEGKKKQPNKILMHILRLPDKKNTFNSTLNGYNAFYYPKKKIVVCNLDKFSIPIFHEIRHRINETSPNFFIKALSKVRSPLAFAGPIAISICSLFTDKKDEDNSVRQKIKNNCGILASLSRLPLVTEECIANIKGTQIAKEAGVKGELLKKVKQCHKISMTGYILSAAITGISVWTGNKVRDEICRLKKHE